MINFTGIAQAALRSADILLRELFPQGHQEGREFCVADLSGASGNSLKFNLDTGVWRDFAHDGKGGADLTSLWARARGCRNGEAAKEIAERLGLNFNGNGRAPETRYRILDADGNLIAIHVRLDLGGGKKKLWWTRPECENGLGDLKLIELPLFHAHLFHGWCDDGVETIVVVEGEKAANSLLRRGIVAAGTVCGAASTPSDRALAPLLKFACVVLWADNDSPGIKHMKCVAQALRRLGHTNIRIIKWPEAPVKGDAADFQGGQAELEGLIDAAVKFDGNHDHADEGSDLDIIPPEWSDDKLALEAVDVAHGEFRYVAEWGRWVHWTGQRWEHDITLFADHYVRLVCRKAAGRALREIKDQKVAHRVATALTSRRRIAAVESLARNDRRVAATSADFDKHPNLLNTPTGIVDLKTGELLPHEPKYLLTQITTVGPSVPGTACPLWIKFISDVMRREGKRDVEREQFLQRALGYSIGGDTSEHAWFFCYGRGGNGKGVLESTMRNILGDYADVLPPEALVTSKNERHPQELAGLRGKRFVSSSEIDAGQHWSISKINRLTGEEMIRAHFMHQNDIRYKPVLHLWPFTNNKPAIGRGGSGPHTERRLHLIEFGVRFLERAPKNNPEAPVANLNLKEELKAEYPAILRWLIDGYLEWAKQRLNPPESMREDTKNYLIDQNELAQWIEERTEPTDNEDMTTKAAFEDWKVWAAEHGEDAGSINQFSQALKEAGLTYDRKANFRGFRNVRLRPKEPGAKEE